MRGNVITATIREDETVQWAGTLCQFDYGQRLVFEGAELPVEYEVHFSNEEHGNSVTVLGDSTGVDIPDKLLQSGEDIYVWIYLHTGEDDGETEYHFVITVRKRAKPSGKQPTPVQQDVITTAIAALATGVETVTQAVSTVQDTVDAALQAAKDSGEFDGPPGPPGPAGGAVIDDTAGAGVTDKVWSANKTTTELGGKVGADNPVFTGSVSMGRKANTTVGTSSTALGYNVTASGINSYAEGSGTTASGEDSHAEGSGTTASGVISHAEGGGTTASGKWSHAEGGSTVASGQFAHAEGGGSRATENYAHAEGSGTLASGAGSHAEGGGTTASGQQAHAEGGGTTASGSQAHAEGGGSTASGSCSHAEGAGTTASTANAHAEGSVTRASGTYSHAEGLGGTYTLNGVTYTSEAAGVADHTEGCICRTASGNNITPGNHAEGYHTSATGGSSHSEGNETTASGANAHAEGGNTVASGTDSHAEGASTTASGTYSHAEGAATVASGFCSHAEGISTTAGENAHAEGYHTTASGAQSHAEGYYTIASGSNSHVSGIYNVSNNQRLEIVGNGTSNSARSNARAVDYDGNEYLKGDLYVGCNADSSGGTKVAKITDVPTNAADIDDTAGIGDTDKAWSANKIAGLMAGKAPAITGTSSAKSSYTASELSEFGDYTMTVGVDGYASIGMLKGKNIWPATDADTGTYWSKGVGNTIHIEGSPTSSKSYYSRISTETPYDPIETFSTGDSVTIAFYKNGTMTGSGTQPLKASIIFKYSDTTTETKNYELTKSAGFESATYTMAKDVTQVGLYLMVRNGYSYNCDVSWAAAIVNTATEVTVPSGTTSLTYTSTDIGNNGVTFIPVTATVTGVLNTKNYIDSAVATKLGYSDLVYLCPEMFGAAGDGTTDDTAALQACIDACESSKVSMRGYGKYKITSACTIEGDHLDIELNKVDYRGTNGAGIILKGSYCRVFVNFITSYSSTGGAGFRLATDTSISCNYNDITLTCVESQGNAIEFINNTSGQTMYYNRVKTERLFSSTSNCLYLEALDACAENSFWGKHCYCNNGWAIQCVGGANNASNRYYEFCIETAARSGLNGVGQLINCRTVECMNKKEESTVDDTGTLIKIPTGYSSMDVRVINTRMDLVTFDVSGANSFSDCVDIVKDRLDAGDTRSIALFRGFNANAKSYTIAENQHDLWASYYAVSATIGSTKPPMGRVFAYYNHKGFVPYTPWYNLITSATYTAMTTDGCLPTVFDMDTDATIYLDDSYCCVGINDFIVRQYASKKATVYAKDGTTVIFDGSTQDPGTYRFRCELVPTPLTVHATGGDVTYTAQEMSNIYTGSNDRWTVEKLNII